MVQQSRLLHYAFRLILLAFMGAVLGSPAATSGSPAASPAAASSTVTLYPTADATIASSQGDTNYGNDSTLALSYYDIHSVQQGSFVLLHFDLSSLPANSIIDSATLRLYLQSATGASSINVTAYGLTDSWSESTVTWNNRPTIDIPPFFISTPVDTTPGYKQFDLSGFARSWYGDSTINYGVELQGPVSGDDFLRIFTSDENEDNLPQLVVTYRRCYALTLNHTGNGSDPTALPPNSGGCAVGYYTAGEHIDLEAWPTGGWQVDGWTGTDNDTSTGTENALTMPATNHTVSVTYRESLPDLILQDLDLAPSPAYPGQPVALTAHVHNGGVASAATVPVRFVANGELLGDVVLPAIPSLATVPAAITVSFPETGEREVTAIVNPEGTVAEASSDNNRATATLRVVWEILPGWAKPDLSLGKLTFDPHRPAAGESVEVSAMVENLSHNTVQSTTLSLRSDGQAVAVQTLSNLAPGKSRPVSFSWQAQSPGRHLLAMNIDPDNLLDERSESNNRQYDWIRIQGEANPLPDLEVESIRLDLPAPSVGDKGKIVAELHNEGYAGVENLPVVVEVDGHVLSRQLIPKLDQGGTHLLKAEWPEIGEGQHMVTFYIDPDDEVPDNSVAPIFAFDLEIPGAQYRSITVDQRTGRWTPVGPFTINQSAYVGRIDTIAVSQNSSVLTVGATQGGIWRTTDGGETWVPRGDHLPLSRFSTVAVDPTDYDIIYAGSGSIWHDGKGLFKSLDGGAHWSTFARSHGTWTSDGYRGFVLHYFQPDTLTIFAGSNNGVWMWQGDKMAAQTAPAEWTPVWQQSNRTEDSEVTSILMTEENPPQLYWAVRGDSVYRVDATNPVSTTVERLHDGFPGDVGFITIGNSPANPQRVYAADLRDNKMHFYRRDHSGTWQFLSDLTGDCRVDNNFLGVHPTNADVLYVGSVKGCRSSDGGKTFPYTIPYVHDDYKAIAFDRNDPSVVFFTSDGGVYRCEKNTGDMECSGLNNDLATTMFFDIDLAATKPERIVGGTQDNGTIMSDGSTAWTNMGYGGDGRYVAIDPADADTIFGQYQYIDSIAKHTDGGRTQNWPVVAKGLPAGDTRDPFMVMDRTNGQVLLAGSDQVYLTTNGGQQWDPIGPDSSKSCGDIKRLAIDPLEERYFAGTTCGEVWAVDANDAKPANWTLIYTASPQSSTRTILVSPDRRNDIYVSFASGPVRIVRLRYNTTTKSWNAINLTGNLSSNRLLDGGYMDATRGLIKEPGRDVLYVGTDRGVYRGELHTATGTWRWAPDSCGLPLTYVSDLEVHPSGTYMAAATFGRSAYTRTLAQNPPSPDRYDTISGKYPSRNDTLATAAVISPTLKPSYVPPSLVLDNLTFDHGFDRDYFVVQLPALHEDACLAPDDPSFAERSTFQCEFSITIVAPETPDPFELRLYRPDGSVFKEQTSASHLTYNLERPYSFFPDGKIALSVRNPSGCRSLYKLNLRYNDWYAFDPPHVDFDTKWIPLPEIEDFVWVIPDDPRLINEGFVKEIRDPLPAQQALFHWQQTGDFAATVEIMGTGDLDVVLKTIDGKPVAAAHAAGDTDVQKQIGVADLPAGWYALEFSQGIFPTYFVVAFANVQKQTTFLPRVAR